MEIGFTQNWKFCHLNADFLPTLHIPSLRQQRTYPTRFSAAAAAHLPNTRLRCGSSAPTQHASPLRQQRTCAKHFSPT